MMKMMRMMITVTKNNTETSRTKFALRGEECYEHNTIRKKRRKKERKEKKRIKNSELKISEEVRETRKREKKKRKEIANFPRKEILWKTIF